MLGLSGWLTQCEAAHQPLKFIQCLFNVGLASRFYLEYSQQTRGIHPMLFRCWASVEDGGPILKWNDEPLLYDDLIVSQCSTMTQWWANAPRWVNGEPMLHDDLMVSQCSTMTWWWANAPRWLNGEPMLHDEATVSQYSTMAQWWANAPRWVNSEPMLHDDSMLSQYSTMTQ